MLLFQAMNILTSLPLAGVGSMILELLEFAGKQCTKYVPDFTNNGLVIAVKSSTVIGAVAKW